MRQTYAQRIAYDYQALAQELVGNEVGDVHDSVLVAVLVVAIELRRICDVLSDRLAEAADPDGLDSS